MDDRELEACLLVAAEAARRAGAALRHWRQRFSVREKGRADLVTEADLAAQEAVHTHLHRYFPDHGFLGEESTGAATADPYHADRPLWIVDPLDGTTNYVHDIPIYAVSIGLLDQGELVAGVVLDPSSDELFYAARGLGAWRNGRRLQTTRVDRLQDAVLSTGFPPDLEGQEHTLASWRHFSLQTRSLRRTGSTALNLAYVAAGRNDGFWTYQAFPWDAAAGVVLIREAGGTATKLDGSPYELNQLNMLCSNGPLHGAMLAELRLLM